MHNLPDAIVLSMLARAPRLAVVATWSGVLPATPPRRGGVHWLRALAQHDGDFFEEGADYDKSGPVHVYHLLSTIQKCVGIRSDQMSDALRTIGDVLAVYPHFKRDLRYRVADVASYTLRDLCALVDRITRSVPATGTCFEVEVSFSMPDSVILQHNTWGWDLFDGGLHATADHAMPTHDILLQIMNKGRKAKSVTVSLRNIYDTLPPPPTTTGPEWSSVAAVPDMCRYLTATLDDGH